MENAANRQHRGPIMGGVAVICFTGLAALVRLPHDTPLDWGIAGAIALVTLGAAFALWRFVGRNRATIGEARFTNRDT